ncbi:hypothetical protein G6F22_009930 [Rhizopus arrhizus]|nr:hypothetical protein G6F22_009930 [Rhizopus arrhizus]
MALAHLLDRLGDAGSIGHVQLDRFHRQALGLQLQCLLHGGLALAAGQQRVHAGLRQLAHGLAVRVVALNAVVGLGQPAAVGGLWQRTMAVVHVLERQRQGLVGLSLQIQRSDLAAVVAPAQDLAGDACDAGPCRQHRQMRAPVRHAGIVGQHAARCSQQHLLPDRTHGIRRKPDVDGADRAPAFEFVPARHQGVGGMQNHRARFDMQRGAALEAQAELPFKDDRQPHTGNGGALDGPVGDGGAVIAADGHAARQFVFRADVSPVRRHQTQHVLRSQRTVGRAGRPKLIAHISSIPPSPAQIR